MMRSLFSGVAGLKSHQTKMDVIGDNISNVNTIGFKSSTVNFQDLLVQTMRGASAPQGGRGGTNAMQVGLGVGIGSISVNNTQGNLQNTGKTTDLAIDGDGFFIVSNGNDKAYTRTGTLDVDQKGNLIMSTNGMKVNGWQAVNGVIPNTGEPGEITIPIGSSIPAKMSDEITFTKNLDPTSGVSTSNARIATSTTVYDSLGGAHSIEITYAKPINTTAINVTGAVLDNAAGTTKNQTFLIGDNSGNLRNVTLTFTATSPAASPQTWTITDPTGYFHASSAVNLNDLKSGITLTSVSTTPSQSITLKYDATTGTSVKDGTVTYTDVDKTSAATDTWSWMASTTDPTVSSISTTANPLIFNTDGSFSSGGGNLTLNYNHGATGNQSVIIDMSSLTQYAGKNGDATTVTGVADGYTNGSLQSISIDTNGIITGAFSNGLTESIGQVALATFNNPGGLIRQGGSLYKVSNNSGEPQIGTSGNGGRGKVTPGALEMSNVDLAQQFTDMIVTQRGFQANSKIISTTDEMLEQLVNLKR